MRGETSSIRFEEAKRLLDYGFNNFEYVKYCNKNDIVKNIAVKKGISDNINVVFSDDAGALIPKGQKSNITTEINLPENLFAPINKGQRIGEITYYIGDTVLNSINIISNETVKKINVINMITYLFQNWFNLLRM